MKKLLLTFLSAIPLIVSAQFWTGNPTQNNLIVGVTSPAGAKTGLVSAKDSLNNVFVAWVDTRNSATTGNDIYIQKINKDGSVAWTSNGIAVCTATGAQSAPAIASDRNDGVIVTWLDSRGANTQVYVQRIDSNGVAQYAADGIQISATSSTQYTPFVTMVNATEAMVFYRDNKNPGTGIDLYLQKINISTGASLFGEGIAIAVAANNQANISILADGDDGAYLAWDDPRESTTNSDIFLQRVNNAGTALWTANGLNITPSVAGNQLRPAMAIDEANGGVFVAWHDPRLLSSNANVFAQKINSNGVVQWANGGVLLCDAANSQDLLKVVYDGNQGAIVTWMDPRVSTARQIYAQRVNSSGAIQWPTNGVSLATNHVVGTSVSYSLFKGKTAGTAIVVWSDIRGTVADVYAQKLNSDGTRAWADEGLIVSNAANAQTTICAETDGEDTIIAVWNDGRSGTANAEIYASGIMPNGVLPVTFTSINAKLAVSSVVVNWNIASEINTIKYDVERSGDDKKFSTVGTVAANQKFNYSFTDFKPLKGNNYYRVKGIDADGTVSYSDITLAKVTLSIAQHQIYPNPFVTELKVKLDQIFTDKLYTFILTDITGKIQFKEVVKGANLENTHQINLAKLSKGVYFLTIKQGDEKLSYQVVKN